MVFAFENTSSVPGLAWIGEAFPEILGQRLASPSLYVAGRAERLRAYDRAGIPAGVHPSRATLYRMAEQLDVDYVVLGRYSYDGRALGASAQLLDMRREKLLPEVNASGALTDLINMQTGLAWELLHQLRPDLSISREAFVAGFPSVRLDAFEQYVRGIISATGAEKLSHFRDAVRIDPAYSDAWLQLGKTYLAERQYEQAEAALSRVPDALPSGREANFYLGLAAYHKGDFARAETAFSFLSARLPLPEISNNLAVVYARRGKKNATELFQRAVQFDPAEPDYHFNLALAMLRNGDTNGAARQLRETLNLQPGDAEAKSLYERIAPGSAARLSTAAGAVTNASAKLPLERMKRNYDENSFRQLALQINSVAEQRLAKTDARTHARFHLERGEELLSHGFVLEAEKEFREAISLTPSDAQAHLGLAQALENGSEWAAARSEAEAALRLRQSADPWLVLARLDLRENKTETAAESVNKALQVEPSNAAALALKRAVAAKLAEKAQPLPNP
ncbi:MAG TPA: tetratricopeptide repeat protein [Terriglobales bacterium]|nr:tetratricopeptide repeat protein [Terriglobales bacterium]